MKYIEKSGRVLRKNRAWNTNDVHSTPCSRHVLDYEDVIRALWLDHSGFMTATDLSRHLVASCPSFYLRPRYTTQRHEVARIDPEFRKLETVCVFHIECILVYCTLIFKFKDFQIYSVHRVALDIISVSKKITNGYNVSLNYISIHT